MNERIKDAWDKAAQDHSGDSWEEQTAFLEKFAELIVRECCQKLEDDGMVEIAIEMKQHFGVE